MIHLPRAGGLHDAIRQFVQGGINQVYMVHRTRLVLELTKQKMPNDSLIPGALEEPQKPNKLNTRTAC